jgi:Cu+-exporting ATPase
LLTGDNDRQKEELVALLGDKTQLYFHQQPQDKLDYVKGLQEKGQEVLMLGDGLNDAGALSQSDCGVVMTEETGSFTPASDAVLQADSFAELTTFFRFARQSVRLVYIAYGLAFLYNVVGLSYAVQGLLSPVIAAILMPLSSVTIVVFGLVSSSLVAWRMGLTADGKR